MTPTRLLISLALAIATLCSSAFAQDPATGTVSGRVSNQATARYLGEAEVSLEGTAFRALTDRDGSYTLLNVAPGTYTAVVSYAGLDGQKQSLTVVAG